jgi:hypothetical protein
MSDMRGPDIPDIADWDRSDPDPWLALSMDRSLPIVRPFARMWIVAAQLVHTVTPRWPHAPRFLHASIAFGMKHFLTPDANRLILRHFHLGAQILRFISDNATPGFHPPLEPMTPRRIDDVRANLFLNHDLNIYNYLIGLNAELDRRGKDIDKVERIDFSAITEDVELEELPRGRFNVIDLQTAIESGAPPIRCSWTRPSAFMLPG